MYWAGSRDGREFAASTYAAAAVGEHPLNLAWVWRSAHRQRGFTWIDNPQLAVITLAAGSAQTRRASFICDAGSWQLVVLPRAGLVAHEKYACRHGLGYTAFETEHCGFARRDAVHATDTVELESRAGELD